MLPLHLTAASLLSQAPAETGSTTAAPSTLPDWVEGPVGIGGGSLLLLLLLIFGVRALRRKPDAAAKSSAAVSPAALPDPAQRLEVRLPPSEAETARLEEARIARERASELEQQRRELKQAVRGSTDASERERLESEARDLKSREEEAKREAYRASKAADVEERERRKREQEEAERQRIEAVRLAEEAAQARAAAAAAEEQTRISAQAGQTLAQGLEKTRSQGFMARLNFLGSTPKQVDESVLGELEEILFSADIGVKTASRLVDLAREKAKKNELASVEKLKGVIRAEVAKILDLPRSRLLEGGKPHTIMVVGVNGSGKTTTIGKLAAKVTASGRTVVMAAGDTFRAAAAEQLDVWAERAGATLVKGKEDSDPSAVIFDALRKAQEIGADVVLADTAGRLHTQAPLMEELKKVKRVMGKALAGAPHEVLLVLDATMGQNAIAQAKQFHEAVGVTAIALTKLDGTAKGGVVIGICDELKLPVAWIGVGEKVEDLRPFEPREFVEALFD